MRRGLTGSEATRLMLADLSATKLPLDNRSLQLLMRNRPRILHR
jgi:hypothetical protein